MAGSGVEEDDVRSQCFFLFFSFFSMESSRVFGLTDL